MIRMPASKLEPGMILAAPIRDSLERTRVFLHASYSLEARTIAGLQKRDIESVWICHPTFDFLDQKLGREIPLRRAQLYHAVKQSFSGIATKTSGAFDLNEYRTVISNMILSMIANEDNAVWPQHIMEGNSGLFEHSSNVAYLSLVIAMRIKEYVFAQRKFVNRRDGTDLTNLGIGAMIHDIGKLGLDKKLQDVHWFEEDANSEEYQSHAERGYQAVQGRVEATAATIVLHHHQHLNGTGFPKQPAQSAASPVIPAKRPNIHVFSRIVAVANAIDGLIVACRKSNAPMVSALAALQQSRFNGVFDPVVVDAALRTIPPFPLGAFVKLSDGRQAVVTDLNESKPCHPKVGILDEEHNENGETNAELDLAACDAPKIVKIGDHVVNPDVFFTSSQHAVRVTEVIPR